MDSKTRLIEEIIEKKVRPELEYHGGDIKIVSVDDGTVRVRLTGNCSGCPSAQITMEEIVKEEIMNEADWVKDVVLVTGVSDELISEARDILRKRHEKG